jgi:hypothetical protein
MESKPWEYPKVRWNTTSEPTANSIVNQPILRGLESYQSDISYPGALPPIVVVLAMFLPSLYVLEDHLCGLVLDVSSKDLARYFHLLLSMRSTQATVNPW